MTREDKGNVGVSGVFAAHVTHDEAPTGCTAIVCPRGATGAVDVRGGAPATRETDLLRPEETVDVLHCVVLSGGSAYGLAAATGAAEELERQGIGLDVGVGIVPIVSSACLFDLGLGDAHVRPTAQDGALAVKRALEAGTKPLETGNVGAGAGCTVGKLGDPRLAMKAGLGFHTSQLGGLACSAITAVNACGNIVDPKSGKLVAGMLDQDGKHVVPAVEALGALAGRQPWLRTNTTISCVITNAHLTKAQATKVAQMSADAYAHAISPTHTTNDGDTIFVMATGEVDVPTDVVGMLATQALEDAILGAALDATGAYGLRSARDLG